MGRLFWSIWDILVIFSFDLLHDCVLMHHFDLYQACEEASATKYKGFLEKLKSCLQSDKIQVLNCWFLQLNRWHFLANKGVNGETGRAWLFCLLRPFQKRCLIEMQRWKLDPLKKKKKGNWNNDSKARTVSLEQGSNCRV